MEVPVGIAVVTKIDTVSPERVADVIDAVRTLLATTTLAGSPVVAVSGVTGQGVGDLRERVIALRDRINLKIRPPTLAIDRTFSVKGRGAVVTDRRKCPIV